MRVYQPASLAEKQASGLVRLCLKAVRCRATEDDTWGSAQTNTCTHTLECITHTKYVYFCANQSAHLPRLIHCIRGNTVQNVFPFDFSVILSVHTSFSLLHSADKDPHIFFYFSSHSSHDLPSIPLSRISTSSHPHSGCPGIRCYS